MAPAWPILRPGGAVRPAINDTTGLAFPPYNIKYIVKIHIQTKNEVYQ